MITRFFLIIILASCFTIVRAQSAMRTWTSTTGTTIEAEYVRHLVGRIVLRKPDGKKIIVPVSYLSEDDQIYASKLVQPKLESGFSISKSEIRTIVANYEAAVKKKDKTALLDLFDIKSQTDKSSWSRDNDVNKIRLKENDGPYILIRIEYKTSKNKSYQEEIDLPRNDLIDYIYLLDDGKIKYDPIYFWHPVEIAFYQIFSMTSICAHQTALKYKKGQYGWDSDLDQLRARGIPTFGLNKEQPAFEQKEELRKCINWLKEEAPSWDFGEPKFPLPEKKYKQLAKRYSLKNMANEISK